MCTYKTVNVDRDVGQNSSRFTERNRLDGSLDVRMEGLVQESPTVSHAHSISWRGLGSCCGSALHVSTSNNNGTRRGQEDGRELLLRGTLYERRGQRDPARHTYRFNICVWGRKYK